MVHHVPRIAKMGSSVLINGHWYKALDAFLQLEADSLNRAPLRPFHLCRRIDSSCSMAVTAHPAHYLASDAPSTRRGPQDPPRQRALVP